jgi:bifunctional non-homologous end joining protein LigD
MPLEEYRRKRDFGSTPEPSSEAAPPSDGGLTFVVHKHAARRLHYDLRLEVGGVYASWAVPKGPSLDPAEKRLAVHVEDHPLAYGTFEGVIPEGEYGGGTVMVWDRGTFLPVGDAADGIAKGSLKFVLTGTKLTGGWALVRMKPRPGERQESWLLIKERDADARPHGEYDVLAAEPGSAASGRTMEQIAASGTASADSAEVGAGSRHDQLRAPAETEGLSRSASPDDGGSPAPAKAAGPARSASPDRGGSPAPAGDEWIHEVKHDGYRLHVALADGTARVFTRTGEDWTGRFPTIARAVETLPASSALLDGEAVVLGADGRSDFGLLQEALSTSDHDAVRLEVFDVLFLDGYDLRAETLLRRKEVLASLLSAVPKDGPLRLVEHYAGDGPSYHAASCELLLEGSISKRGDRPWVGGRTRDWQKAKCLARQEFVVVGWTDPAGSRHNFGSLLLGVHDANGALLYTGKVGTGFTERTLARIRERLDSLAASDPPFAGASHPANAHWVRPELVAEVSFREWTRDGLVRQASFKGLRDDKRPGDVVRESPAPDPPGASSRAGGPAPAPSGDPDGGMPLTIAGVTITHPALLLQPAGITKADLARYYESVSAAMLPHVLDRPLTIVRCPHGAGTDTGCFYQKHPEMRGWPAELGSVTIQDREKPAAYFFVRDEAGLVALAQLGTLEIHTWGSLASDPERPDRVVFDLDPGPGVVFADVAVAARAVQDVLGALGLSAFVKTTGGRGLHVVTPVLPERDFDAVRTFAHGVVDVLATRRPDLFTGLMRKTERTGRVFADYLRNAHGATAVCAFSTRARPGATVSVPIAWEELDGLDPARFDVRSVPQRLASLGGDPWAEYATSRRPLTDEMLEALDPAVR